MFQWSLTSSKFSSVLSIFKYVTKLNPFSCKIKLLTTLSWRREPGADCVVLGVTASMCTVSFLVLVGGRGWGKAVARAVAGAGLLLFIQSVKKQHQWNYLSLNNIFITYNAWKITLINSTTKLNQMVFCERTFYFAVVDNKCVNTTNNFQSDEWWYPFEWFCQKKSINDTQRPVQWNNLVDEIFYIFCGTVGKNTKIIVI